MSTVLSLIDLIQNTLMIPLEVVFQEILLLFTEHLPIIRISYSLLYLSLLLHLVLLGSYILSVVGLIS